MNDYIIVRAKGLYKIYCAIPQGGNEGVYQYAGASFVMLADAKAFLELRNGGKDAA